MEKLKQRDWLQELFNMPVASEDEQKKDPIKNIGPIAPKKMEEYNPTGFDLPDMEIKIDLKKDMEENLKKNPEIFPNEEDKKEFVEGKDFSINKGGKKNIPTKKGNTTKLLKKEALQALSDIPKYNKEDDNSLPDQELEIGKTIEDMVRSSSHGKTIEKKGPELRSLLADQLGLKDYGDSEEDQFKLYETLSGVKEKNSEKTSDDETLKKLNGLSQSKIGRDITPEEYKLYQEKKYDEFKKSISKK